ncbi:amino acid adenylation domain-containing protein [Nostoc sp. LEGE 12447]|uniref:non-ribosomal peptide synthetase n=1 Tax=Nostoc sp. LEGE 12447 TaxID=1828640 RepID=UPI00188370F4|nr:non-ribosomal peptide synthetase [Nostoc sp. LEGE 12447]MBE9003324.1 amino acid adenylation domain-containing protein [Nostoc sp. LEGE 12447]
MGMQNVEDFYPLSPMQQGLLFHTLSAPDTGVYFNQLVCTLSGQLNIPVFERVWQQVIQRHSILRTCFRWEGLKEPIQVVLRQVQLPLKHYNWQGVSSTEQQEKLEAFLESDRTLGIDLSQAPLMRLALIQASENTYHFVWNTHHLITDGWSTSMLLEEVFKFYTAFCQNEELRLEPPRPYRDYIKWLQKQDLSKAETFWRQTLNGFSAPTNLRIEKTLTISHSQIKNHAAQQIKLSASQTAAMRSLVRQQQITLNTLVQGAWAWLLSYYSGEKDVVFGVTVSGRPVTLAGAESMVGLFINTLPLRVQVAADTSVVALLKQIQAKQAEISQYEYSPLVQVQGWSEVPRGMSLFDSILVFENYPVDTSKRQIDNLEILNVVTDERTNYPLTVTAVPSQELSLEIAYDRDRFDDDAITRMLGHLGNLLAGILANPEQRLSDLPLLTEAEKHTLLVEWNNTEIDYPQDQCIHQLFEAQVEKTPDAVAVVYENYYFTYQELNQRANQLAHYLQKLGVGPEVLVGICVERSLDMIVALLGILKAGGAYLPLDPNYPPQRLAFMLQDAQVKILLTQAHLLDTLPPHQAEAICVDRDWKIINNESQENINNQVSPINNAYILYTSGSTGQPKAVIIEHQNAIGLIYWAKEVFNDQDIAGVLASTSICFDLSIFEIFVPLSWGGKVIVAENLLHLQTSVAAQEVTLINTVPSAIAELLKIDSIPASVRTINLAGEPLPQPLVQQLYQETFVQNVFNLYGPSEDTTYSTFSCIKPEDDLVTIGRPIANTQIYILDSHLQPLPIGIPGEVYICSTGLARGYLKRQKLTAEKFISNPFSNKHGARLYKTGDLARYLLDGNIEFLGRVDHQVKIRGFRIELGEIEAKLAQHSVVQHSVVVIREDKPGDKRLIAYIVPNTGNFDSVNNTELIPHLRKYLKENLPKYMVPSAFVLLEKLPLTPNGKIDRKALPLPGQTYSNIETTYIAPRTAIEEQLAKIWAELLKVKQVGIEDNFFELGGHSLLLTQLIFQIRQTWKIELPLSSLFEMPTIASLTQSIETAQKMGFSTLAITPNNQIDWQTEAVLDPTIRLEIPIKYPTQPTNILLTGATGFVGAFLLYELLQQTHADIYCLVRAANAEEGKKRIQSCLESYLLWNETFSYRIIPVVGNLSKPLLGLSRQGFQELTELIDVIYHNGAWVHHTSPYSTLKGANVLGTQEVLRLASQVKIKPVHFISTNGVFSPEGYSGIKIVQEQDNLNDYQVPSGGYTQSKWVAEKLVNIARDRGLTVTIHRIGRVSGHSKTGVFNQNDFLYRLIIGCIKLEKVPDGNMIEDMAPVDYVSKAVVYLSRQEKSIGKAFHFVNSQPFHSIKLIKLLRSLGYPLQQISNDQWQADLINIAEHYPEHPLYPLVPLLSEQNHNSAVLKFDCQNTLDGLANTSIICPPIDDSLLNTYLSYLMQKGFLEAPKHKLINI